MPFRQRVARRLGDAVSSSDLDYDIPISSTLPLSDKENEREQQKGVRRTSRPNTTGKFAQKGKGGLEPAAKRTKQSDKMLAEPNANKVSKRTGGVGGSPKKPYEKKIYQKVARVTRSTTKLTNKLSSDSKPYLSCKSLTPFAPVPHSANLGDIQTTMYSLPTRMSSPSSLTGLPITSVRSPVIGSWCYD